VAIGANFVGNCSHLEGLDYMGLNVKVFGYAPTTSSSWTQVGLHSEEEEVYESLFSDQSVALSSDGNRDYAWKPGPIATAWENPSQYREMDAGSP
jgi:hypothetical protein